MSTTAIQNNPKGLTYPVRFVLPSRTAETLRERCEAERLATEQKAFPHRLNLSKAPSDIRRGGHSRWILVEGKDRIRIADEASRLDERLTGLLNKWGSLSEKKPKWHEAWTHGRVLRRVNTEMRRVSDRVSELNQSLFDLIPEGKVWQVFCACTSVIPGKSFDSAAEYADHKQTCRGIIGNSDEVAEREAALFDLLRRLNADPDEIKRFENLVSDAKESAIRTVNVLKDPGIK